MRDISAASKMDGWDVESMDENDTIFKPKNKYEQLFWEKSRALAKNDAIRQHKSRYIHEKSTCKDKNNMIE
jgi:hypothetical protein